jgi:predicted dehydrogenase
VTIRLTRLYGRNPAKTGPVAAELGIGQTVTDWRALAEAPDVDIVANAATNALHGPLTLAALELGKPVLCEKPLSMDPGEASRMCSAAAGIPAAVGFNYRFVPALALLRRLIQRGQLGQIRHYRGLYLQDWLGADPRRAKANGSGTVSDYSHLIDMLRVLAGEPASVMAQTTRWHSEADDAFQALFALPGGGTASLEASRCATGWKGRHHIEVNGSLGSAWWDMEDINRLHLLLARDFAEGLGGYRDILVTEADHPYLAPWWPTGHVLGWEHTFTAMWRAFLTAVLDGGWDPALATFADGLRSAEVAGAIYRAAAAGRTVTLPAGTSPPAGRKPDAGRPAASVMEDK